MKAVRRLAQLASVALPSLLLACLTFSSSALASECPNEQLRQESAVSPATGQPYSMALPDCRAYELVTPGSGKNGATFRNLGSDAPTVKLEVGSGAAEAMIYNGTSAFGGSLGSQSGTDYYSVQRGADGWVTTDRNGPAADYTYDGSVVTPIASADATKLLYDFGAPLSQAFFIGEPNGSFVGTVALPSSAEATNLKGASSFLNTIVAQADGGHSIQIVGAGGSSPQLYPLGIGDDGQVISDCATALGSVGHLHEPVTNFHAISESGETVFFTAEGHAEPGCPSRTQVYAQIDATQAVDISEPSSTDCPTCETALAAQRNATFQGASADGSKVFFTTQQQLFSGQTSENIYEYSFAAEAGHKISLVSVGSSEPKVQGVVRISDDGSHVYFVAQGVLTSVKNSGGQEAQAGADNLYVYERDAAYPAGHTQFIAALCSGPTASGTISDTVCPADLNSQQGEIVSGGILPLNDSTLWLGEDNRHRLAQSTPDGQFMVFDSYGDLTSDKTSTAEAVYLYDAASGSLVRASVGQEGYDDDGNNDAYNATIGGGGPEHAEIEKPGSDTSDLGAVSEDGSYVFFDSSEALVPDAVAGVEHVYEYHEGQVQLISDGQDEGGAVFLRATLSASDVFFTDSDTLVSQDVDAGGENIYDARIDGGFPALVPVSAGCSGDACQGSQSPAPALQSPASALFTGGANVTPPTLTKPPLTQAKPPAKKLTRAQKLAKALKKCKAKRTKKKRAGCQKQARKRYGAKPKAKSKPKVKRTNKTNRRGR